MKKINFLLFIFLIFGLFFNISISSSSSSPWNTNCLKTINISRNWELSEWTRNNLYYKIDKLISKKLLKYSSDRKIKIFKLIRTKISNLKWKSRLKKDAYKFVDLMMACYIKNLWWDIWEDEILEIVKDSIWNKDIWWNSDDTWDKVCNMEYKPVCWLKEWVKKNIFK